jgi:hypothetical protein
MEFIDAKLAAALVAGTDQRERKEIFVLRILINGAADKRKPR